MLVLFAHYFFGAKISVIQTTTSNSQIVRRSLHSPGQNRLVFFMQHLFYWPFRLVALGMLRGQRIDLTAADIKPGEHYVIASNHQTHVDPFVNIVLLPYPVVSKLGNVRTIAHTIFFNNVLNRSFMTAFGAFPTKEHPTLPYGLDCARDLLSAGQTVQIFPEGKMTVPGTTPAKQGVAIMAQWDDVKIIPVHMDWRRRGFQRSLNLGVGKPFDGHGMSAQEILDRILALPVK